MANFQLMQELAEETTSTIVLLVCDGLGGAPLEPGGPTELEAARTPNLDRLAAEGQVGLIDPVSPGVTPGSGPAHLALFGYDPLEYRIGRGVLEALGIDFELTPNDVAARGNFCTLDAQGRITDRRAGRISTAASEPLVRKLDGMTIDGVQAIVMPVREHRFVAVFRGEGLSDKIADTDPQQVGLSPKPAEPLDPEARRTAEIVNEFARRAQEILAPSAPANGLLLRGFSKQPALPTMGGVYRLRAAAVALYPMYRGLAKLVGMKIVGGAETLRDAVPILKEQWGLHNFFYIHLKKTDAAGEDGAFERKVTVLEQIDDAIPELVGLAPDVLIVTGDHSTPAAVKAHSWHPVPVLLRSKWTRASRVEEFSEYWCTRGELGRFPSADLMQLAMAYAGKLEKYGA